MDHTSFKVKILTAPHCTHSNSEDFYLSLDTNRKHEKLLKFKKHEKEVTHIFKQCIHHKPDMVQIVVDNDQDLMIYFENNEDCDETFKFFDMKNAVHSE